MVRDVTMKFGEDAGRIWSVLAERGCVCKDDLISFACLDEDGFQAGLGWLARENKISRVDDDCFKLDVVTNLVKEIGSQAGRVWRILDIWGEADFVSIVRLSGLSGGEVFRALGWLAREGKVFVNEFDRFCLK